MQLPPFFWQREKLRVLRLPATRLMRRASGLLRVLSVLSLRVTAAIVLAGTLFGASGFAVLLATGCHQDVDGQCRVLPGPASVADADFLPPPLPFQVQPPTSLSLEQVAFTDLPAPIAQFLQAALPYALKAHQTLTWPTSVILAQWGVEHSWRLPDATGWNWGNVQLFPGCPIAWRARTGASHLFCYAYTPDVGLSEYLHAAQLPFYISVTLASVNGADAAAYALGRSPWDAGHYAINGHPGAALIAMMRAYTLYRCDSLPAWYTSPPSS